MATVTNISLQPDGRYLATLSDGSSLALPGVAITASAVVPGAILPYRNGVTAADGATKPAASSALFTANPGGRQLCRVFITTTGNPTTCTLRAYVRSGGTSGQVQSGDAVTLNGAPGYDAGFDVAAEGDDLAVLIESLAGGASPAITIALSWR